MLFFNKKPASEQNELIARDKVNLAITWLRDDSLEDVDNLPAPEIIAREIVEDLAAALAEFEAVAAALEAGASKPTECRLRLQGARLPAFDEGRRSHRPSAVRPPVTSGRASWARGIPRRES